MAIRVLYVLGDVPTRGTGGQVRIASTLKALAGEATVDVIYPERGALAPDEHLKIPGVRLVPLPVGGRGGRVLPAGLQLARGRPLALARSMKRALAAAVEDAVGSGGYDCVVADQIVAAATCLQARAPNSARAIYNAHNIEWTLRASLGTAKRVSWAGTQRLERRVFKEFDEAWVVSESDRQAALELAPTAKLRVVPNAVDLDEIPLQEPASEPNVLFVASFGYPPNRDGFDFLLREVMPLVWDAEPLARLEVVGRWPEEQPHPGDDRVNVRGFVDNLADSYRAARAVVAPLRRGGGSPLKVVEGLAFGLPVVATPVAIQALVPLVDGGHVAVGAGAEQFAGRLCEFLSPGYRHGERGRSGRAAVEHLYSVDAIREEVAGALSKASNTSARN